MQRARSARSPPPTARGPGGRSHTSSSRPRGPSSGRSTSGTAPATAASATAPPAPPCARSSSPTLRPAARAPTAFPVLTRVIKRMAKNSTPTAIRDQTCLIRRRIRCFLFRHASPAAVPFPPRTRLIRCSRPARAPRPPRALRPCSCHGTWTD